MEHPVGFAPTIEDLQSSALATWLWVHKKQEVKIKKQYVFYDYNISIFLLSFFNSFFFSLKKFFLFFSFAILITSLRVTSYFVSL